jgi:signal transduction histidine kinase
MQALRIVTLRGLGLGAVSIVIGLAATLWADERLLYESAGHGPFFTLPRSYGVAGLLLFAGQLALIVGLLVHRGRLRHAEEESRSSQERYRSVVDRNSAILRAIPDLMFMLRCDGTYVDYHARDPQLLFAPPDRFIGRTIREILPASVADILMDALGRACRGHMPVIVQYELPMDEPRHFEARLVRAEHDRVLTIVRDITDWKRILERNRDLAGRLIASQEDERTRIARDLHDGISQDVAAIAVEVCRLRQHRGDIQSRGAQELLGSLQQRTADVAESLRLLSHGLHPTVLQHIGLVAAVEAHCAEIERQQRVLVTLSAESDVEPASQAVALSLFRITQEALRNAVRHGHARHAIVSLRTVDSDLRLTVTDDGAGFDVLAARRNGGLGLSSIEERARLVHGHVTIRSRQGHGTSIDVRVPRDDADDPAGASTDRRRSSAVVHNS